MTDFSPFKMAKIWIYLRLLVVVCVLFVGISNGEEEIELNLQKPPLLNYKPSLAGDNEIDSYGDPKEITLDFNITYFGSSYNSIYISKDGIIGFAENIRYRDGIKWSDGIRQIQNDRPFLAPFYHNGFDPVSSGSESYQGSIFYRLIYAQKLETAEAKEDRHFSENKELLDYVNQYVQEAVINPPKDFKADLVAIVTWDYVTDKNLPRAGNCNPFDKNEKCNSATFQAVIIADKENTFAMFNYLEMNIPFDETYQAGFNGGFERGWASIIPCVTDCHITSTDGFSVNVSRLNDFPNLKGSDFKGRYFLNIGGEEIVRGGCLPPELSAGVLEAYPREVGMFGGEKLEVSGKCLRATSKIYCKFGQGSDTFETEGVMTNDMKGYCPVPIMTIRGSVQLSWSSDGEDWSASKRITVVIPKMVGDVESQMAEADILSWHKRDSSSITVKWSPERMSSNANARVQIKLIGYRETKKVEFKELENLGEARNSEGRFTFQTDDHACSVNCEDFQMGLLEVGLVKEYFGVASNRVATRYGPIPLGWYVNKELSKSMGDDWSDDMCHQWHDEDKKNTAWLNDLSECPCNLDQALADFGRWQAYPECDLFTKSKCRFHKDAKHCVTSIQPTSSDAGNMCCYHKDGTLMYTQLTFGGGAPSRKHILGTHPFNRPGKVPIMSNMKTDVIPYFHCCYWRKDNSDMCHHYTELRPTTDCDKYEVPGLAMVRGDPHITTFDGSTYHFGGKGDFHLLARDDIDIQGRFEPRRGSWDLGYLRKTDKTSWKPNALTHLAIQGSGIPLQVYPAPDNAVRKRGLDILVEKKRYFFYTLSTKWQEFGGAVVINNALSMDDNPHNNFTIITNNVGINVVAVNNLLHVTVALPPSMKNKGNLKGMGLLGMFDGNRGNDYISRSDTLESPGVRPKILFDNFAMSWAVQDMGSLFQSPLNAEVYKDDTQYYSYDEIPHDFARSPSDSQISSTCNKDMNCKWDYRITSSQKVAVATRDANKVFHYSQGSAYKVENCGLPAIGDMAVLSSYNFSAGEEITVTGCHGDHTFDGEAKFKCIKEKLENAKIEDRDDYGRKVTDNYVEYIVHWVPKPHTICKESGSDGVAMGTIIGCAVGGVIVIIIIIVIIVLVMKKRKGGSERIAKPRPADRVRKDNNYDDGTDEPMMDRDRKPVYNPRRQGAPSSAV